jgi:myosin heavy subunit
MPSGGAFETDALAGLGRGSEVWVSVVELEKNTVATESESSSRGVAVNEAGKARYAPATVVSLGVGSVEVRLRDEKMVTSVPRHHVFPANLPNLAESQNLTQLSFLNEPSVLRNLRDRYKKNKVYTNAGPVLVAVNPFKDVSGTLYGDDLVKQYMKNETKEPHVYKVVVEAYRHMRRDKKNQALIIAGESGAGKTETTKIALRCLATVSVTRGRESDLAGSNPAGDKKKDSVSYGQSGSNANTSNTKNTPTLESKLCDANPALEVRAFPTHHVPPP